MKVIKNNKQPLYLLCMLMIGMGGLFPVLLVAGDWKISPNVSIKGTYTDNANLFSADKKGGFYTQVTPGVAIKREGAGRIKMNANYSLSYTGNRPGSRGRTVAHSLASKMQAELYKDVIFLDAGAGARLGSATSGGQRGGDSVGDISDPIQTYTYSLSPYTRHHLGRYADILARYTFNQVINSGGRSLDSYSNQAVISINSGSYFTRFPWGVSYRQSRINNEGGAAASETTSINANISYVYNRKWRINLNGGKVDYDIQSSRSSTDSVTWSTGATWTPTPRTDIDFSYGRQMFGQNYGFDLNHRWRRATWRASYKKALTNSRAQQLAQSNNAIGFSGNQSANYQRYSDYATLTDEYYVIETLNTGFTLGTRRSNFSVDAHFTRREYEVSGNKGRDIGTNTSWSRQLTPKTDLKAAVSWQKNRANENAREDTRWTWSLGLSKRLTEQTSANLDYKHRRLDSTANTGEYRENQISLSLASRW
ncbi:MAG: TIGR03016 family PEP-CTERM system-associated outer membrane protein [Candidatus Polarisedimenticolaceae bacterium]|nr:TIGR03016 family PEP-CTERM system-associated outer membrane protein [Candidatus Polarisedimenticolaceae bacterium]